jgi:FKBP-type peptidyl-prolyl cis-trans isomerase
MSPGAPVNRRTALVITLAATMPAAACGGDADRPADRADAIDDRAAPPAIASSEVATTYAPELNVDLSRMTRLESGLHLEDLEEGRGEPVQAGQMVLVHYTGWLADGSRFDSSREPGRRPFDLVVGRGEVIEGWEQGLVGMREGGRRMLVIPPSLGYGTRGAGGVIPPNATLVFDVELVEVR